MTHPNSLASWPAPSLHPSPAALSPSTGLSSGPPLDTELTAAAASGSRSGQSPPAADRSGSGGSPLHSCSELLLPASLQFDDAEAERAFRLQYAGHSLPRELCLTALQTCMWLADVSNAVAASGRRGAATLTLLSCLLSLLHLILLLGLARFYRQHRDVLSVLLRSVRESALVHLSEASMSAGCGRSSMAWLAEPRARLLLKAVCWLAVPPLFCGLTFAWSWVYTTVQLAGWLLCARTWWAGSAGRCHGMGAVAATTPQLTVFWEIGCTTTLLLAYGVPLAVLYCWETAARERFVAERLGHRAVVDRLGWQEFVAPPAFVLLIAYRLATLK